MSFWSEGQRESERGKWSRVEMRGSRRWIRDELRQWLSICTITIIEYKCLMFNQQNQHRPPSPPAIETLTTSYSPGWHHRPDRGWLDT